MHSFLQTLSSVHFLVIVRSLSLRRLSTDIMACVSHLQNTQAILLSENFVKEIVPYYIVWIVSKSVSAEQGKWHRIEHFSSDTEILSRWLLIFIYFSHIIYTLINLYKKHTKMIKLGDIFLIMCSTSFRYRKCNVVFVIVAIFRVYICLFSLVYLCMLGIKWKNLISSESHTIHAE